MLFTKENNTIYIDDKGLYIEINGIRWIVTRLLLLTETDGKLITDEYIIKYNKGKLYLYDLNQQLLGEYIQNPQVISDTEEIQATSLNDNRLVLNKFVVSPDLTLVLSKENLPVNPRYFINDISVLRVYNNGFDTVYETPTGKLQVSTRRHTTWNGCPVKMI